MDVNNEINSDIDSTTIPPIIFMLNEYNRNFSKNEIGFQ